jgi:hypothetical protein
MSQGNDNDHVCCPNHASEWGVCGFKNPNGTFCDGKTRFVETRSTYVFEQGPYPNQIELATLCLSSDEEAIKKAEELKADYVWKVDANCDRNPESVWRKPRCN